MHRKVTPVAIVIATAVLSGLMFAFVEGLAGILVAILGTALAVATWRRERPAYVDRAASRWWVPLFAGLTLLAVVVTSTTSAGELSEPAWAIAAIAFLASFAFIAAGFVLAFLRLGRRRSDLAA